MSSIKDQIVTLLKQRHYSHKAALEQEKDPRSKHAIDLIARIREDSRLIEIIDSLPEEKPSLPDNLDEAARESMPEEEGFLEIDIYGGSKAVYSMEQMLAMFRAGAKLMAEQGFISEGIIYQTSGEDTKIELNEHIGYLEDCDEVIVNIRKKKEKK